MAYYKKRIIAPAGGCEIVDLPYDAMMMAVKKLAIDAGCDVSGDGWELVTSGWIGEKSRAYLRRRTD